MAKRELHHMEIHPAENGGHTVHHHFKSKPSKSGAFSNYEEPEHHVFGPEQGQEMMAHVSKHLGISGAQEGADEEKISPGIHKKVAKMEESDED